MTQIHGTPWQRPWWRDWDMVTCSESQLIALHSNKTNLGEILKSEKSSEPTASFINSVSLHELQKGHLTTSRFKSWCSALQQREALGLLVLKLLFNMLRISWTFLFWVKYLFNNVFRWYQMATFKHSVTQLMGLRLFLLFTKLNIVIFIIMLKKI